jgi:sialate O-acetylesterase
MLAIAMVSAIAQAAVKLPAIIGDNMVLQRDKPLPIWGWDEPGKEVKVTLGDASATAKADDKGLWMVTLPAMKAGGPFTLNVEGSSSVAVKDVLVGEVWLCSGQSNMEWTVDGANNPQEEKQAANYPKIRHIKINHRPSDKPEQDVLSGGWQVCSPQTAGNFTAVGYYFGRELQKELDGVPIGLIGSNWGGTRIEPWTPPEGFKQVEALKNISDNLDKFPEKNGGNVNHQSALALYNGMIHGLVPYAIRGAIWYQGESNNGEGMLYYEKMKALISGWRSVWKNTDMPFYFVQLAPFRYGNPNLPYIWEAQSKTLSLPHTGMAVTVDISNIGDIHPRNKQDVGKRLALWALAKDYGKESVVFSGPLFKEMKVDGNKVRLAFDHVGGGLVARDGKPLTHFQVAGEDKNFVNANAVIEGNAVVVSADGVANPVAVRFGWAETAEPNLSNKEGLPASPFRTDSW